MKKLLMAAALALGCAPLAAWAADNSGTEITPLAGTVFTDIPGKEGALLMVQFAPGASNPVHRHNAYVFVYVLEGAIVMQVKGGMETTVKAGQTFVENPKDIHTVGRNASQSEPAKFLAFFVKDKDAPPVLPAE